MTSDSHCNDETLLLFLHEELSLATRLKSTLHLAACPACRERLRQFSSVSTKLATSLVQPGETPRLGVRKPSRLPAPLGMISALLLVILGSVGTLAWQWRKANPVYPAAAATSATLPECTEGCETDCVPSPVSSQHKK